MKTSKLTFITKKADDANEVPQKGLKVFNIVYTIKLDDSTAIGTNVMGTGEGTGVSYGTYDESWEKTTSH